MARPRLSTVLALAAVFAASAPDRAAADGELSLGVEAAVEYDDNVLYDDVFVEDDGIFRVGPRLQAYDRRGELQWDVRYFPSYEKFFSISELDGWDHDAEASVSWRPSERTYLRLSDHYVDYNRAVRFAQSTDVAEPGGDVEASFGRQGFKQNVASLDFTHRFWPRHTAELSLQSVINEGDPLNANDFRNQNQVTSASIGWLYDFSQLTQAGLTLQATRQEVDRAIGDEARTDFYNLGVQVVHQFSPTFYMSASAGPTLVRFQEQPIAASLSGELVFPQIRIDGGLPHPVLASTCPTLDDGTPVLSADCEPAGGILLPPNNSLTTDLFLTGDVPQQDTSDITYFANIALIKRWATLTASLRYVRDASTTSNFSGQVRDVVSFTLNWTPEQRWRVLLTASWENRDQTQEVIGFARTLVPTSVFLLSDAGGGLALFNDVGVASGLRAVLEDADVKDTRYLLSLTTEYRLTKRVTLFTNAYWIRQETSTTGLAKREIDRVDVIFGVRFYFDPIQLPI